MRARWNGKVVAESEQATEVRGYFYFSRDAVRMEMLRPASRTPRDLECPHGVQFFDLVDGDALGERLAWSYEQPRAAMQSVDHWIGFWRDVCVER